MAEWRRAALRARWGRMRSGPPVFKVAAGSPGCSAIACAGARALVVSVRREGKAEVAFGKTNLSSRIWAERVTVWRIRHLSQNELPRTEPRIRRADLNSEFALSNTGLRYCSLAATMWPKGRNSQVGLARLPPRRAISGRHRRPRERVWPSNHFSQGDFGRSGLKASRALA
jgi:hypothetical protein